MYIIIKMIIYMFDICFYSILNIIVSISVEKDYGECTTSVLYFETRNLVLWKQRLQKMFINKICLSEYNIEISVCFYIFIVSLFNYNALYFYNYILLWFNDILRFCTSRYPSFSWLWCNLNISLLLLKKNVFLKEN